MITYSTISVPKTLHEEIRRTVVEDPELSYSSVAEFSKEAISFRLDELRVQLRSGERHRQHIAELVKTIEDAIEVHH